MLLPLSDTSRPQVHSLGKCAASRPQAEQLVAQHQLRPEDMRLRLGAHRRSGPRPHRFSHRVRGDALVSRARDHAQLEGLQQVHRRVERRLHTRRDAQQQAALSRQALSRPAQSHLEHHRLAERRRPQVHTERASTRLSDQFAQEGQSALR